MATRQLPVLQRPSERFLAEPVPLSIHDRSLRAAVARAFQGISPTAGLEAYADWLLHLAMSPGKQAELVAKALRKAHRFSLYAMESATRKMEPCIDPLPQDHRFRHAGWQHWPFNLVYQAFLLSQQWWWNATTDVKGVSRHHEQVVSFAARQMLDVFSPSNFVPTNPEVLAQTLATMGANLMEGAANAWRDYMRQVAGRPPEGAEAFRVGVDVAVTPGKVVLRNQLMELIQYAPQTAEVAAEPVLLVPSWIMKYYILDLSPHNSLVRWLVERGHTVFAISWKNPDLRDRDLGMDEYLKSGALAAIDAVRKIVPEREIHAVGYCLGGTLLSIAAALLARAGERQLQTVTLLASEVDFEEPGELSLFIDESQLAYLEDLTWEQGYLDGKQMAGAFALLNSKDLIWSRMVHDYLMGARRPFTDLMVWNADATRLPHRMHSEYLRRLYLDNDLTAGHYFVDGRPVALTDIRAPVFALGTERDHVSPWRSVYKIHLFTDTEITFCLTSGGHNVGVVNPPGPDGRTYQISTQRAEGRYIDPETWAATTPRQAGSWWPAWQAWLAAHSSGKVVPPRMGAPEHDLAPIADAPGTYVLMQ
ncbi:MAG: polyhydroxyalkanoic acid synthase [Burkholderiales bacterium]|nr:polyhydroxyalkanoic acid synthase [Burkholderiales bacterium]